jgi:competence protein ComEC
MFVTSKFVLIKTWIKATVSSVIAAAVVCAMLLSVPGGMFIVFLDVGQGDAAYLRTQQGGEYFIDGGRDKSTDEVVNFAVRNSIRPDAAFVTHSDADHFSGIRAMYEKGLLKKVYCSYQESRYVKEQLPDADVMPLCAGDIVWLDKHTTATVLYPYKDTIEDDKNEVSLVLLVEYAGNRVLLTGDISGQTETLIFSELGKVDIYKAAHHGSKYSSFQFPLSSLKPEYSVISTGYNTFGHPHPFAIANLEEYSGKVYTTIDDYAIEFFISENIKVKAYGDLDE